MIYFLQIFIYFFKMLMYLIHFLNIDILALNIDILPDILNNDILSSFWKRGKYGCVGWCWAAGPHDFLRVSDVQ